jgi:hypothetical protein
VKLIDAIATLEKRTKDEGWKARVSAYPVPRLWDLYKTLEKRAAHAAHATKAAKPAKAAAAPAAKTAKKAPVEKKPAAKKAAK